jgi:hypothetical protein
MTNDNKTRNVKQLRDSSAEKSEALFHLRVGECFHAAK